MIPNPLDLRSSTVYPPAPVPASGTRRCGRFGPVPRGQRESYVARGLTVKSARPGPPCVAVRRLPPERFTPLNGLMSSAHGTVSDGGLLATLAPIWQIVIGGCVLFVVIAASVRLARRGRS